MYNRYIRAQAGEDSFSNNFIPVSHSQQEYETEQLNEQLEVVGGQPPAQEEFDRGQECGGLKHTTEDCRDEDEKKAGSFLSGLFDLKKINADTLIVLGIALFILCDNKDDTGDVLLILAVLILLGF